MAASKMRHFNSPEELAKRQGLPDAAATRAPGFRHYNHPEEIAKRAGKSTAVAPPVRPQRRVIEAPGESWPPPGQDNTGLVKVVDVVPNVSVGSEPSEGPSFEERLRRLEGLIYTLVDDRREARTFRMNLLNLEAVVDSQRTLGNRLLLVEQRLHADDDDEPDDDGSEPEEGTQPPPAVEPAPEGAPAPPGDAGTPPATPESA